MKEENPPLTLWEITAKITCHTVDPQPAELSTPRGQQLVTRELLHDTRHAFYPISSHKILTIINSYITPSVSLILHIV